MFCVDLLCFIVSMWGKYSHAAAQLSHCLHSIKTRFHAQVSPCGICGGQSDTGADFSPSSYVLASV